MSLSLFWVSSSLIFPVQRPVVKNRKQPVYSDPVLVKDKRTHVWGGGNTSSANTSYYITFEFENGERQEFMVSGKVYGEVAPGDTGTLTGRAPDSTISNGRL